MNKDLFEQRIGETLRKAETTPPAGAWEIIRSQIAAPYTPPFTFPTWMVVAVSALLLGGMALSDENSNPDAVLAKARTEQVRIIEPSENQADAILDETIGSEDDYGIQFVESKSIPAVKAEEEPNAFENSEIAKTQQPNRTKTFSVQKKEENPVSSQPKLPVQLQAVQPLKKGLEEASAEEERGIAHHHASNQPLSKVDPQLVIEGVTTCYTPCELSLSAKGNASVYSWDAASFGLIQGKNLNLTIDEPQTLMVYAIGEYEDGTVRSMPKTIEVVAGSELFVPNSFTPNGDGLNDEYLVGGNGIESFSMTIINSTGKVVFQTSNINETWSFNGSANELENEVYTAIIRAIGIDGKVHTKNQRLTILP